MALSSPSPGSPPPATPSPSWGPTTKLVVGLTIVAIIAAALIRFRNIIGPLILAFILAYLLHPVAARLSTAAKVPWRTAVNLIYLLLIILFGGLVTLTGLAVIQQIQSLVGLVQTFLTELPEIAANLSNQVYKIGPFEINLAQLNLQALTDQLLASIQPLLGRVGGLVGGFASSAASTLGWTLFVMLISYFLLADADRVPDSLLPVEIPGYTTDIQRLGMELRLIWNAFLRGQLIIILLVIISYTILMTILGVRYAVGIAILAGLARFVPYIGPLTTSIVTFLVAFFQNGNYFGLQPLTYAILVVVAAIILDQIFDNLISPRFLGHTLGVHPAAVLISAIIATSLIGVIGLVLAAPVLATVQLLGRYIVRKMFDQDPWPATQPTITPTEMPWARSVRRLRAWFRARQRRI
jgi:predicted PurR-regulated permease PerM